VSGKVVVGQPAADDAPDPHAMAPLPGQAPERPIVIVFDGGSKGNPGLGYGSYAVRWPGQPRQIVQLQFGDQVTNNEAEYDTLIAALEAVLRRLIDNGAAPATARLDIRGDSALVVNQVNGEWKCQEPRMQVRRDRARELLARFSAWQLTHHDRSHSVALLGH
jgi:ribonuclease HI